MLVVFCTGTSSWFTLRAGLTKVWAVLPEFLIASVTLSPALATTVLGCHWSVSVASSAACPLATVTEPLAAYGPGAFWPTTAALGAAPPAADAEGAGAAGLAEVAPAAAGDVLAGT